MERFASDSPQPAFYSIHSIASLPYPCPLEHPSGEDRDCYHQTSLWLFSSQQQCLVLHSADWLVLTHHLLRLEYNPGR